MSVELLVEVTDCERRLIAPIRGLNAMSEAVRNAASLLAVATAQLKVGINRSDEVSDR
jgi:hypothetical protein